MTLENLIIGEEYLHNGQFVTVMEILPNYVVVKTRGGEKVTCAVGELKQKPARMG